MAEYTPSAWVKPASLVPKKLWKTWLYFSVGKTSVTYADHYKAATQATPHEPSVQLMEDFSMHVAKLRLKRQL